MYIDIERKGKRKIRNKVGDVMKNDMRKVRISEEDVGDGELE